MSNITIKIIIFYVNKVGDRNVSILNRDFIELQFPIYQIRNEIGEVSIPNRDFIELQLRFLPLPCQSFCFNP